MTEGEDSPKGISQRGETIRPARPHEADAVAQLVTEAYRPYIARIGRKPGPMLDDYAALIAEGSVWVGEDAAGLFGALVLLENAEGFLLDNVAVSPTRQKQGHGRTLIAFAETEARRRGWPEIRLYTHVQMTENIALYTRLGFVETGRVSEKGFDRVYMAKALG
jgi:ribosomal protein S18 acetylase RimI-like enzyme